VNENNFNPSILYLAKLSFKIDDAMQKQNSMLSPSQHYKRFYKEHCIQKMKANKTMKGQAIPNHRRRKARK
jgi:hypothetical protein